MLTEEKILIPSAYAAKHFPENCKHKDLANHYRWSATTVGYILDRQEYLGHTVLGKSICENFKTKQRRAATPDELMIFPDTGLRKRLVAFSKKHPDLCRLEKSCEQGGVSYVLDKSRLSICLLPPMS